MRADWTVKMRLEDEENEMLDCEYWEEFFEEMQIKQAEDDY